MAEQEAPFAWVRPDPSTIKTIESWNPAGTLMAHAALLYAEKPTKANRALYESAKRNYDEALAQLRADMAANFGPRSAEEA